MCKRSFSDFAARPNNKRKAAGGSKVPVSESTRHAPKELTIREMLAAGGDLEQITSSFCGLTNAVHPIFAEGNICVCRHENGEYCYRPELIAELDSATNKIEGLLEPTWNPPLENVVLRSALQLATRFITHEDTLPFWAGLLDCARNQATDVPRPFRVRARKHLSTEKANSVLEFLSTEVASRIRIHFRSFALIPEEFSLHDVDGFCTPFEICDEDPNFDPAWSEIFNYAWRDGKPAMEADAFPHIFMNVDEPVGCNTSSDDWLDCTVSEVKASIIGFASTIGHEFAHAVAVITQNGGPPPRLNDEAVIETGCSWEQFVFGGKLSFHDDDGQLYVMPWPNYEIWKVYAAHDDDLELREIGGGALPLARIHRAKRQMWERFLEQRFWEGNALGGKDFQKAFA
jgi:hypothetical protein